MSVGLHELEIGEKIKIRNPECPGIYDFVGIDGMRAILRKDTNEIRVSIGRVKKVRQHYEFIDDIYLTENDGE